jgi:hypothetical protein
MFIRDYSIQDYLKNINRSLSTLDCVAIFIIFLVVSTGALFLRYKNTISKKDFVYHKITDVTERSYRKENLPFASKNGATYTFSWCSSSSRILEKNRIYFQSEIEAMQSGRRLSKLCKQL